MNNDVPVSAPTHARKWSGMVVGPLVALGLPIIFLVIAAAVTRSSPWFGLVHDLFNQFGLLLAMAELLLAPLGIVILGRALGVHGSAAWLGLLIVGVPVALFLMVASVLQLSGALGMPF